MHLAMVSALLRELCARIKVVHAHVDVEAAREKGARVRRVQARGLDAAPQVKRLGDL